MTFGEKLREARKEARFSQEEFAEKIGVSRSAVAKWESDRGLPDVGNLKVIASLLNISIDYLLDDGIRICTFLRLGCLTFENVIIPDTYEGLLDPNLDSGLEIPDRYWYFDWIERLSYKMMLFGHSVAASRNTTYFFDAKDGESLVRFYKENVN